MLWMTFESNFPKKGASTHGTDGCGVYSCIFFKLLSVFNQVYYMLSLNVPMFTWSIGHA